MASVWAELKRRNVVKVAVAYAIVAWLLAQLAEFATQTFGAPAWVLQIFVVFLILGFPVALILAWAYEMTPEGIRAASSAQAPASVSQPPGPLLNYVILGLMAVAVTVLIVDQYVLDREPASPSEGGTDSRPGSVPSTLAVRRAAVVLPDGVEVALADSAPAGIGRRSVALSPNGTYLAFTANRGQESQIYLRRMDEFEARPIDDTEGAFGLFFSPDGQWIGYFTPTRLMKVAVRGGNPEALADAAQVYGATWGPDNTIVFAERDGYQFSKVSAEGGDKQVLFSARFGSGNPEYLPGGKAMLFNLGNSISLFVPGTEETPVLLESGRGPRYVPTGHIVYSDDGGISAVPFDLSTLAVTGSSVRILTDVRRERNGVAQLDFSADGWLAYVPGSDTRNSIPTWVDRNGVEEETNLPLQTYGNFRLSPDGSQLAFTVVGPTSDIWLYDFERATSPRKLTAVGDAYMDRWSPDGTHVVFGISNDAPGLEGIEIRQQRVDGSQTVPLVTNATVVLAADGPGGWSADELLTFGYSRDVWAARVDESERLEPFIVDTPAHEWGTSISPDGRFIVYTSDESGQYQVYVKPYPPTDERWMISDGYGEEPVWSPLGNEIFYRRGDEWLSVPVQTGTDFESGLPQPLFEGPYLNIPGVSYDVSEDAQRFLVLKQPNPSPRNRIHIVANWFEELNRLAPSSEEVD